MQIQTRQIKDGRASFNRPLDKDRIPLDEGTMEGFYTGFAGGMFLGRVVTELTGV